VAEECLWEMPDGGSGELLEGWRPHACSLAPTSKCNLRCIHCDERMNPTRHGKELSGDEFGQLVERLRRSGVRQYNPHDGKPLPDRETIAKCEMAAGAFPTTWVVTNGTLEFPDLDVLYTVSLDGGREAHDRIRGAGTNDRMRLNVKRSPNTRIVAICTVNTINFMQLPGVVECAEGLGMEGVIFNWHTPSRLDDPLWLNYPLRNRSIDTICKLKGASPELILNSYPELDLLRSPEWTRDCPNWLVVSYDAAGRVKRPCIFGGHAICERCGCHVYPSLLATYPLTRDRAPRLEGCGSAFKADTKTVKRR